MPPNFLARMRPRLPLVGAHGQDEAYSPPAEGCDLLGTGVDHLRAYLTLHPTRMETLIELCAPVGEHMRSDNDSGLPATVLPRTAEAVAVGEPAVWEALLQELLDSTAGGPGLTVTPLIVLMSRAMSNILYSSDDNGMLFAASEARETANEVVAEMPDLLPAITELVSLSRDAIGLRAARIGLDTVLLHRRVSTVSAEDIFRLQQLGPLSRPQLDDPDVANTVLSMVRFRTLSTWASDLPVARDWPLGEDPGTLSSLVLSIRVPITSLWFAPRSNDREFLISPDAITLEHVEILHRA
jgi:hypothetical protein